LTASGSTDEKRRERTCMPSDTVAFPEGTVTVLSTDLVGSTLLNQRLGDTAATALKRELAALAQEQVTGSAASSSRTRATGRRYRAPAG
jgi:class 3 adenylate cyclase